MATFIGIPTGIDNRERFPQAASNGRFFYECMLAAPTATISARS